MCDELGHLFGQRAMVEGNQSAMDGNATKMVMRMICAMMKGVTPRKIVSSGISLVIPLMTNTFIPIGGVMRPSSTTMTMMMPNQTGS